MLLNKDFLSIYDANTFYRVIYSPAVQIINKRVASFFVFHIINTGTPVELYCRWGIVVCCIMRQICPVSIIIQFTDVQFSFTEG